MLKRTFQSIYEALVAERSCRQIALGIALGVMIGILPKANLIAVLFIVLLFAVRANLAAGLLTAGLCSWIGFGLDPISHRIGETMLTYGPLQNLFGKMYQLPYAPWTSFNNTVVMGSLILGLLQFIPTYFWCRRFFGDRPEPKPPAEVKPKLTVVPTPKLKRNRRKQRRFVIGADVVP